MLDLIWKMRWFFVAAIVGMAMASCGPIDDAKPTNRPTAEATETSKGPVKPEDRPARPAEGVEGIEGCPVNRGIVVDIYHGPITESQGEGRVGQEAVHVLRWVNDSDHPSGDGGCWQQTAFTGEDAMDKLANCVPEGEGTKAESNWTGCVRD